MRIRYKLEGVDTDWQEPTGPANIMRLMLGFLDQNDNEVMHKDFEAKGQSPGWTGSFETSPLQHRREQIVVPPNASRIWVVISSAGAPGMVGAYFVGNLTVRVQNSTNGPADNLLNMEFNPANQSPVGWLRAGPRASMARVIGVGPGKRSKGLAIVDDNPSGHAQWNSLREQGPRVSPLDVVVLEWDEMFSIALATPGTVSYKDLKPGFYRFSLKQLSLMGVPTGDEAFMTFEVLAPFWRTSWFWVAATFLVCGLALGGWRYRISRQLQIENARLAQQQELEAERFRIARDIHDDFGARVTQISLLSSESQQKPGLSPEIQADFAAVSEMSRNLVGSLYETVWAISPENDHLDSLGTYICQMANQMCGPAGLKCRLEIPDLPHEVPITSSLRHNLVMTIKEAIHNVIKHAEATEVQIKVQFENGLLAVVVKDNGKGFAPATRRKGNGLLNMERRIHACGGRWTQSSQPGQGTCINIELRLSQNGGPFNQGNSTA
ncbi:MAG: sensor histidine kinase [Verrucomicrobia bacterium]|nr:sensor histidine kinase [Verrucomicrobiota bacterium]